MTLVTRSMVVMLFVLVASSAAGQTISKRMAVPSAAAVVDGKKALADVYKKEIDAAKTTVAKLQLARRIIAEGDKSAEDVALQYACYDVARLLAVSVGGIDVGLMAANKIAARFEVEPLAMRVDVVHKAAANAKTDQDQFLLTDEFDDLVPALTKAKLWPEALECCRLAIAAAKKMRDTDLAKVWNERLADVTEQQEASAPLEAALATLDKSPADAAANATAGELLCLTFHQWDAGLSMLALARDNAMQPIAERELKATTATDRLALADEWYGLAENETGIRKRSLQRHAMDHYRAAEGKLMGLAKTRVQKRIAELFAAAMPNRLPLSELKPTEYRVLETEKGPFLVADVTERRFPHSLWCHAPNNSGASVIVFELPCEFQYLKGGCAFLDGTQPRTAVQFRANGNAKEVFRLNERIGKPGTLVPFRIELKGVRRLELIVDCPGDFAFSHTVWVSPMLQK
jgi:hypothetical protein